MGKKSEYIEYMIELLQPLGVISSRNMFGGCGLYCDGMIFGLFADDMFYLKVDHVSQELFEAEGLRPFTYESKGKEVKMSYYQMPESAYDDQDEALKWGQLGIEAALRQAQKKKKTKKRSKPKPSKVSK